MDTKFFFEETKEVFEKKDLITDENIKNYLEKVVSINKKGKWEVLKIHYKGPKIVSFKKEKEIFDYNSDEIQIHPSFEWTLPKNLETKHFFIIGAPGSGKTQLITPWIFNVRERGDKVILYDNKGDFTEILEELPDNELILVAPWDKRGYAWEIGKDIFNLQLAREFATKIIPEAEEPIYSHSARLLLVGAISYLQETKGTKWGFRNLYEMLVLPREEMYGIMRKYYPQAAELIREPTKLSQNIITNLLAGINMIADLARIWDNAEKTFSVRELIKRKESFTLVMQGSGLYREMANALIGSIIVSAAAEIETLPDSNERRVWFFLDEFPQLGFLPGFTPLLEIGRSKGICVVLAMQNINQLFEIYGEEVGKSIQAMCNTHFYNRLPLGSTASFISEYLGNREVVKIIPDLNANFYAQNYTLSVEYERSVPEFVLSNEIGTFKDGIRSLLVGLNDNHILIDYEYTSFPKQREKNIWANWTLNIEERGEK